MNNLWQLYVERKNINYHQSLINHEIHESFSTTKYTKGHEPRIARMGTDGNKTTKGTKTTKALAVRADL